MSAYRVTNPFAVKKDKSGENQKNSTRRAFLTSSLAAVSSLLAGAAHSQSVSWANRPNIVFIFADDLGYGDLGCYGHPYAETPALDRLASEGTVFKQFYVTGVTCCPSRTGIMTSRHPASFKKYMSRYGFSGRTTITELLKKNGYRTGHFGKWHIGPNEESGVYGIDEVDVIGGNKKSPGGRDADLFGAAIDFIGKNKDRPFYVNVWGHITHFPVDPVKSLTQRFNDVEVNRDEFGKHMQKKFDHCEELEGDVTQGMRNYLGDVYSLDLQVGRLLEKIDALGLRENTIVVFSSDQGPAPVLLVNGKNKQPDRIAYARNMLGYAGGLRGGKHTQYEGGVRSPFIIRWPGRVPAGKVNESSVISGIDWLPTLCGIADIEIDKKDFEGEDISDIWTGANRSRQSPLFWKANNRNALVSMRDGKWKIHLRKNGQAELYDLQTDVEERYNLAEPRKDIVAKLKGKIDAWESTLPNEYLKKRKRRKE
ncbi:sulfatase-like hydrolase/transferase [bacterium]|nr:sulfatase-like hydrolase/transferase [bacterium]